MTGVQTCALPISEALFAALRVLDVATLIIGHTPKTVAEGQAAPTIYGSVFNSNFARSTWELKTEQEVGDDCAILGLFHRKTNLTRKHPPIGLKVTQDEHVSRIHYAAHDLRDSEEMARALPLPNRIRNLLETDGTPRTSKQIAEQLGEDLKFVRTTLGREQYKNKKWSVIEGGPELLYTVIRGGNG